MLSDKMETPKKRIAILGGGPAGLFMYKRLTEAGDTSLEIEIFERKEQLGAGMPYSREGSSEEHITNVSGNEIPDMVMPVSDWIALQKPIAQSFHITPQNFNDYKVLPRLLFGKYLEDQFALLLKHSSDAGISTTVHLGTEVIDIEDHPDEKKVTVKLKNGTVSDFDRVIISTGHNWPKKKEGTVKNYFDSPYPPSKLEALVNIPVAVRGSSLTAVDAIRTLARNNGSFADSENGIPHYIPNPGTEDFRMVMHSRSGLLPAVRFHLEDSHLKNDTLLTDEEITAHRAGNDGFLSLDYLFEKDFKDQFREKDPAFYERIRNMDIRQFVDAMMELRERLDPFVLLKAEYAEAEKSIKRMESVYWKEMLAVLSFAMNYPAKYFSAEDMLTLKETLSPLISIVIAFIPQTSCRELLALHNAGKLEIVAVGGDSRVEALDDGGIIYHYTDEDDNEQAVPYPAFVDSIGQPHLMHDDFPFRSLIKNKTIAPARLRFQNEKEGEKAFEKCDGSVEKDSDGSYFLKVPGIGINDDFQVLDQYGAYNERIYIMAVPYIGGFNPDYSGLDFCEAASEKISGSLARSMV